MVQQRIHQRPVAVAGGRVDDEPGGLVDDEEMLVLEDHPERNVLSDIVGGLGIGDGEAELLTPVHLHRGIAHEAEGRFHGSAPDQRLKALARQRRHRIGQGSVEPHPGVRGLQPHVDRLITPH